MHGRSIMVLIAFLTVGCADPTVSFQADPDVLIMATANQQRLDLGTIPADDWWYRNTWVRDTTAFERDDDGVILFIHDGQPYYHPVLMAQYALRFLDHESATNVTRYGELAALHADRLLAEATRMDGLPYFPYGFDWALHRIPDELMHAPWYSGMAQGQILSLATRLFAKTGDPRYAEAVDQILRTLVPHPGHPEVARIDSLGFYWIVEYPIGTDRLHDSQALNGMLFALMGVYEVTQIRPSPLAHAIFRAGITTLATHVSRYRVRGELSRYCLRHGWQIAVYHRIHITQLRALGAASGVGSLIELADSFADDACPDGPPCGLPIT